MVLLQPLGCCLWAHLWHPRNIISAIPHQSEVVDDLLRVDSKLLPDPLFAITDSFHGIDQLYPARNQLGKVLVAANDRNPKTLVSRLG